MRRPAFIHWLLAAYCGGLCCALAWPYGVRGALAATGLAALGGAAGAAAARRAGLRRDLLVFALVPLFAAGGLTLGAVRLATLAHSDLTPYVGRSADVVATVLTLPDLGGRGLGLDVRVDTVDGVAVGEKARLDLETDQEFGAAPEAAASDPLVAAALDPCGILAEGARIRIKARVDGLPEAKPGQFDYGRYLARRGEHVVLAAPLTSVTVVGRRGGLAGLVDRLRVRARTHLRRGVRPPVREVLEAMVLGDDQGVDDGIIADFRNSGLLHILAVSGENVVLLCAIFGALLRGAGLGRNARLTTCLPLVALYVVVTGASPSIVRAGVAGVVGLLAGLVSRPADGWLLWLLPAAWILSFNPNALFDVSFQLSFAAVAGLLLVSRPFTSALSFLPPVVAEPMAVTTAASLATAPVSIATFGQTSAVAVPANVAGGFILGPVMFLGMVSVLVGFVSPWLSLPLNVVAATCIAFLCAVAGAFAGLPFAVYQWHGPTTAVLLLTTVGLWVVVLRRLSRRAGESPLVFLRSRRRRVPVAVAACASVALVALLAPRAAPAPTRTTLTILDVGEGAAALLQAPGGPTVLIDAGPEPLATTLRAHGVHRIDLLVLSHGHADHTYGLADVLGSIPVGRALVPVPAAGDDSLVAVEGKLRGAHVPVAACQQAVGLRVGAADVTVLPTGGGTESGNQGENDCALVVVVDLSGQRVLLPGDAEAEVLDKLDLAPCAVVELPHHGSAGGFSDSLLQRLAPRLAVISVGDNKYGHPTTSMLELLRSEGVPCVRTDRAGEVRVWVDGGRVGVATVE